MILLNTSEEAVSTFWQTFGGPIATLTAVIISGFIGVILFLKGIEKERRLYQERRKIEKDDIISDKNDEFEFLSNYFLLLLDNVIIDSRIQSELTIEYAKKLIKHPTQQINPTLVPYSMIKRVLEINNNKILEIFFRKKIEEVKFISLLSYLDYLNEVHEHFINDLNNGVPKNVLELANNVINLRIDILNVAVEYLRNEKISNIRHSENPLYNTINNIVIEYYNGNNRIPNIQWDYAKLVIPIKDKLLNDSFRTHTVANDLLTLAKKCGDTFFSVQQFNTEFGEEQLIVCQKINDVCNKVEEIKNEISEKITKLNN